MLIEPLPLRWWGRQPYQPFLQRMRDASAALAAENRQELWLVEHEPVFTQGLAGRPEHVAAPGSIPVVATERGGQVTYHGPGQVVAYPLVDLRGLGLHVREYVYRLEQAVLRVLQSYDITGHRVAGAPGIYVRLADPSGHAALTLPQHPSRPFAGLGKIAALGIKVSRHRAWHGLALNGAMDLSPFDRIDPCGYPGLRTVDLATLGIDTTWNEAAHRLAQRLRAQLLLPETDPT